MYVMNPINATEAKTNFGHYLYEAMQEPITIEKHGRPTAVLMSFAEYQRLQILEDAIWEQRALEAEKEGFLGPEESMKFIQSRLR